MNPIALISTRKGLFQLNQDLSLKLIGFDGIPVSMALADKQHQSWYVALDHGHYGVKFHRSQDQGKTWQELSAPSYPQEEDGASLKLVWSLEFAEQGCDDKLWAGTVPGGLFYSDDGGQSWQLNEPLWQHKCDQQWFGGGYDEAGIHSICIHPQHSNHISVAVSCAGVWETTDNGQTWQNKSHGMRAEYMPPEQQFDLSIQDPHLMVRCPSDPDKLWVQHHNGIFKSTDSAANWSEITTAKPSNFGFTVAVHPTDANTAWFVPAIKDECRIPVDGKFVVSKTTDGGETFSILDNGLGQDNSYDIVFRHGLDIDASGDKLLVGSTTGNLWFTDNQGENWRCLSHYLPPIYALRFIK